MATGISPNFTQRFYNWSSWKTLYASRGFSFQYEDDGVTYVLWFYDGPEVNICRIWKTTVPEVLISVYSQVQNDSDKADFETNYKINGNKAIGNFLTNSLGVETGVTGNPFVVTGSSIGSPELNTGKLFSVAVEVTAATGGADNPLVLLRNPVSSGKTLILQKAIMNTSVVNVPFIFKVFGAPVLTNGTAKTITNITQTLLSTTVTVTTSAAHGAVVGANITISGTTNFNGTWTVASVTSSTVFTFNRPSLLSLIVETSGSVVVETSVGVAATENPLKRTASPTASVGISTTLPTVSSTGIALIVMAHGQNAGPVKLLESGEISLDPGQSILFTANPASNNRNTTLTIIWAEV